MPSLIKLSRNNNLRRILIADMFMALISVFIYSVATNYNESIMVLSIAIIVVSALHVYYNCFDNDLYITKDELILKKWWGSEKKYKIDMIESLHVNIIPLLSNSYKVFRLTVNGDRFNVKFHLSRRKVLGGSFDGHTSSIEHMIKTQIELMKD